jgi:hypothetical protein
LNLAGLPGALGFSIFADSRCIGDLMSDDISVDAMDCDVGLSLPPRR